MGCDEGFCEFCGFGPQCSACGRGGRTITPPELPPIPTRDVYKELPPLPALCELSFDETDAFTDDELEEFARKHQQDTSLPELMRGRP